MTNTTDEKEIRPWYTMHDLTPKTDEKSVKIKDRDLFCFSSEITGLRPSMEDTSFVHQVQDRAIFAIFDGHGGKRVADYAKERLPSMLEKKLTDQPDEAIPEILRTSFLELDAEMFAAPDWPLEVGATALVCVVTPTHVYCANAGDSRCVISTAGVARNLSKDHKPTLPEEEARIVAAGKFVRFKRVNWSLAISRALGDKYLKDSDDLPAEKQAVTAEPEVITQLLAPEDEFIIMACDGIWDVISSQDLVNLVRAKLFLGLKPQEITRLIHQYCLREKSGDNMSISIICLTDSITNDAWLEKCRGPVILEGDKVFDPAQDFHVGCFPREEDESEPPSKRRRIEEAEEEAEEVKENEKVIEQ